MRHSRAIFLAALALAALLPTAARPAENKKYKTISNDQAAEMLAAAEADVREHYYDPNIRGLDVQKRFAKAKEKIQSAKSQDEALLDIAGAMAALQDPHTRFIPPVRPYGVDYGWIHEAIANACCFVAAIRPDSDAAHKGLKPGDQIVAINGITLTRQDIDYVDYSYSVFPQSGLHLLVRSPQGIERQLVAMAKVNPGQAVVRGIDVREWLRSYHGEKSRSRYYAAPNHTLVWRLPDFLIDPADVDGLFNRTHSYDTLILDLRGNPGGIEQAMLKCVGNLFDHDVQIGFWKGRKDTTPITAKARGKKAFLGKLILLIDSRSASASEMLARVIQLEKRGTVLGDRSAGAVAEARDFVHAIKLDATNVSQYTVRVSVRQVTMNDGKTLENEGVTPDDTVIPTADDLAAGRDPVLARAIGLAGTNITREEAGKVIPFEWPPERMPEIN
jgi:carboxyl-terminal processing protease